MNSGDTYYLPIAMRRDLEQDFREKWGREPGPHDPLFWNPKFDHPVPLPNGRRDDFFERGLSEMEDAGLMPAAWFYAARKCERMVMPQSRDKHTPEELSAWDAAMAEYDAVMPSDTEIDYICERVAQAADSMMEMFDSWIRHVRPPSDQVVGEIGLFASLTVLGEMMRRALVLHPDRELDDLSDDVIASLIRMINKLEVEVASGHQA